MLADCLTALTTCLPQRNLFTLLLTICISKGGWVWGSFCPRFTNKSSKTNKNMPNRRKDLYHTHKSLINQEGAVGLNNTYRHLRNHKRMPTSTITDPKTGEITADSNIIHHKLQEDWEKVFNQHIHAKPDWGNFIQKYKKNRATQRNQWGS